MDNELPIWIFTFIFGVFVLLMVIALIGCCGYILWAVLISSKVLTIFGCVVLIVAMVKAVFEIISRLRMIVEMIKDEWGGKKK